MSKYVESHVSIMAASPVRLRIPGLHRIRLQLHPQGQHQLGHHLHGQPHSSQRHKRFLSQQNQTSCKSPNFIQKGLNVLQNLAWIFLANPGIS